jgi:outer membrane protein TolC
VTAPTESLLELEALALQNNPTLRRLRHEAAAEFARVGYIGKLPDPSVGGMVFTPPMQFEPDRQRAELQAMQMIPWLGRLRAEERQVCMEAMAAENLYRAERLKVLGELRSNWFQLYIIGKQIETTEADTGQLESLVKTANARVATGDAQPGDVLMATLELSSLQEQALTYDREFAAASAEINRLVGRNVAIPIPAPSVIDNETPDWDYDFLRQVAHQSQPELQAARLRTAASRWGIEVARLKRRPDVTLEAGWMVMDAPGAMMPGAGRDSFTLGLTTTVPLWKRKYDAMTTEASRKHYAAHATEEETALEIDATIYGLWRQAETGRQTLELYEKSILPQARQTFEANQQSLVNNTVTFDRVVRDYRAVLTLQLAYHKVLGEYATTLARIRQAVGVDLVAGPSPESPSDLPSTTDFPP